MKLLIAAIGKAKDSPERELYRQYVKRLPWKLECREVDAKLADAPQRKQREGELLLDACRGYDCLVALDEGGQALSSREFSVRLGEWQRRGDSSFAFVIGGSDGLDEAVRKKARLLWSFGRVTWPHMLMRALLAEQLYRAHSLLSGHPYHRD